MQEPPDDEGKNKQKEKVEEVGMGKTRHVWPANMPMAPAMPFPGPPSTRSRTISAAG